MCPPHSHITNGSVCTCDDGWSGNDLWDNFPNSCQVNELARKIINAWSMVLPGVLLFACIFIWWTVARKEQLVSLHSVRSNTNLLRFAFVYALFGIAYGVWQFLGMRHADTNYWFFALYQMGSASLVSVYVMSAYIWTRTFLRTHGAIQFLQCSLSKSTNGLLLILWLAQLTLMAMCMWDNTRYRLLAEISVSISWFLAVLVMVSVAISILNVDRALRQLGVQEPKIIGRAFYRIRLSWSLTFLVGAPTLGILPCFVFQIEPLSEYMYICFNVVLTNASLATGVILMQFRTKPSPREHQTAAEKSLLDTTSDAGSTVMISAAGGPLTPRSKSTPWKEARIDQESPS